MQERLESHIISSYFAPRGHNRMYALGRHLAQIYLSPFDKLIGIIGDAGAGKSALIRGMFPGLELTNDDDGVYIRYEKGKKLQIVCEEGIEIKGDVKVDGNITADNI